MTTGQDQGGGTEGAHALPETVEQFDEMVAAAVAEYIGQHRPEVAHGAVYSSIAAVMDEVEHIGKDSAASGLPYKYRGIEAVLSKLGPRFRSHRLCLSSSIEWQQFETVGKMTDARVVVRFRITSTIDGTFVEATSLGEGRDSSDKAANKAMTQAQKYALCQLFMIPTGDPDPEAERPQYDTSVPMPPPFGSPPEALQAIRGAMNLAQLDGIQARLVQQKVLGEQVDGHPLSVHVKTARGMLGGQGVNDYDDAALGDRHASDEDLADVEAYEAEQGWAPHASAALQAEAEVEGAQGGGPHAAPSPGSMPPTMPSLAPGHEECDPRGMERDPVEGWICSCGVILGELPDASTVAAAVAQETALPSTEVAGRDPIITTVASLNPDQITPAEIERQLSSIMARLELGAHFQREVEVRAFNLRQQLDVASAQTITRLVEEGVKGDAAYRKNKAITENEQLYRDTMEAEEMRRCVRETMHNLRSMQTGFQTIARSVGVTYSNPMQGVGGGY